MASARDLKNKIRSISNTRKITHTMELVATSKAQRAQNRVRATTPYSEKLRELLMNLSATGTVEHPLLSAPKGDKRTAALVVTGNRGLCGGYNSVILQMAEKFIHSEKSKGREVDLYMVGIKGLSRLKYLKLKEKKSYTHFDDRPMFKDASDIGGELISRFLKGELDQVVVFSTRFISAGNQVPEQVQILPIVPPAAEESEKKASTGDFIFEPDPQTMLEEILPLSVKNIIYRLLVESAASEQLARRMAMKRATDNAEEMVESYTRQYNRSRQAGITQQINEIVSGASALE